MGVQGFYRRFEHDGVRGPNMATVLSDRGHGVRAPVVFYNRSNEAAALLQARRLRLEGDLRRGRPLVPQRRHLRRALADHPRGHHRGDEGGEGRRRRRLLRPQLPRQAVEDLRGRGPGGGDHEPDRGERGRAGGQRGGPADGPGPARPRGREEVEARPERLPRDDRDRSQAPPAHQGRGHHPARGPLHEPALLERGGLDRRARPTVAPTAELDVLDRVGGGDGFASGFFYGLHERRDAGGGGQAGLGPRRAAHHLPRRHHDGHRRTRSGPSPAGARRASSAEGRAAGSRPSCVTRPDGV